MYTVHLWHVMFQHKPSLLLWHFNYSCAYEQGRPGTKAMYIIYVYMYIIAPCDVHVLHCMCTKCKATRQPATRNSMCTPSSLHHHNTHTLQCTTLYVQSNQQHTIACAHAPHRWGPHNYDTHTESAAFPMAAGTYLCTKVLNTTTIMQGDFNTVKLYSQLWPQHTHTTMYYIVCAKQPATHNSMCTCTTSLRST
jgi:hypothetical protein